MTFMTLIDGHKLFKLYLFFVFPSVLEKSRRSLKTFCLKRKQKLFHKTNDLENLLFLKKTESFSQLKEKQMKTFCFQNESITKQKQKAIQGPDLEIQQVLQVSFIAVVVILQS